MSSKSKRLGALADIFRSETLEGTIRKVKLTEIEIAEIQPRSDRTKGIEELAESLKSDGLLQPILVTRYENAEKFKIIAGERRFRAARSLGWLEIECKILNKDENDTYKLAIIENLQRENLSPFEEADSIALLKEKFAYTDEELSHVLGKSRSYTTEILSIVSLPKPELQACKESGMNTKNLLIQASLAYKKGIFSDFLQSYKTGEWKTVKDAKSFNQQTTKKAQLTKKDNSKSIINESISLKKNQIHITCKDEKSALKAFETIKESIKQYLK